MSEEKKYCNYLDHCAIMQPFLSAETLLEDKTISKYDPIENKDENNLIHLVKMMNHWLKVPDEKLMAICDIVKMLRAASIIIDDIFEDSVQVQELRLNDSGPAIHEKYGLNMSLNTANLVYMLSLHRIILLGSNEAVDVFNYYMVERHRGTGTELLLRQDKIETIFSPPVSPKKPQPNPKNNSKIKLPSLKAYSRMMVRKNGALLNMAVRLLYIFSDFRTSLRSLLDAMSLLMHVRNDYITSMALQALMDAGAEPTKATVKEMMRRQSSFHDLETDIVGVHSFDNILFTPHLTKLSYPLLLAVIHNPRDKIIQAYLNRDTYDVELNKYYLHHLVVVGSLKHTKSILRRLRSRVNDIIQHHGGNKELENMIEQIGEVFV